MYICLSNWFFFYWKKHINQNGCEEGTFGTATGLKPGRKFCFICIFGVSSKLKRCREVDGVSGVRGVFSSSVIELRFLLDLGVSLGSAK
jgi:hypothetical protein